MMTEDEMIAVIQSYNDGKQIQCALKDDNRGCFDWDNVSERCGPQWNFQTHIYRVAPEPRKPREWKVYELDGHVWSKFDGLIGGKIIRVREVIE